MKTQFSGWSSHRGGPLAVVAALSLSAVAAFPGGPAAAGDCVDQTRDITWESSSYDVKTEVKNNTKYTLYASFFRDGSRKQTQTVKPGDKDHYTYGIGDQNVHTLSVAIGQSSSPPLNSDQALTCDYDVWYVSGSGDNGNYDKSYYTALACKNDNQDDNASHACENCTFHCDKSFDSSDGSWTTKWTIND